MDTKKSSGIPALQYFALTFAISWAFWIPAALSGQDVMKTMWVLAFLAGGFGPSAAGVILLLIYRDRDERRVFWKRLFDFRRISFPWYLFIFLIFPTLLSLGFLLHYSLSGSLPALETLQMVAANPSMLAGLLVGGLLTGPLSEELGWRGFALDRLQDRWSPLTSSLITALLWWGWHLPLFSMKGTTQAELWLGGPQFWVFMLQTFPLAILLTWVANHNQRSILAPVLLHFAVNTTLTLAQPLPEQISIIFMCLLFLAAAGLVVLTGDNPHPAKASWDRIQ